MTSRPQVDYIIVGMGLAGSCLAYQLMRRNKSVVVFDEPSQNKSTSVAAGLINPITGKMMAKTWSAERLLPFMRSFYREAEAHFGTQLFFPMTIYTPFASVEEQNEWMGRSTQPALKKYIEKIYLSSQFNEEVHDPSGGIAIVEGGHLDTHKWTQLVKNQLIESGYYREEKFDETELLEDPVVYRDIQAKKIIFCRGIEELHGRYFSQFPIRPLKGETLMIRTQPLDRIYNRGVYVVPTGQPSLYRVGATYQRDGVPGITEEGQQDLIDKLNALVVRPYEILTRDWGIRPTTVDRRPLLGHHRIHQNVLIFNGLGTKGALLGPFYSNQLAAFMEGAGEIGQEVNITRFKSLYSRFEL